jgi:high frequency lysogenization protein
MSAAKKPNFRDKTLALAGIFQAAGLADSLAWHGHCDPVAQEASLKSLLVPLQEHTVVTDFYGHDVRGLFAGLKAIEQTLSPSARHPHPRFKDVLHYAFALMFLERQLNKNKVLADELKRRLDMSQRQLTFFRDIKDPGMVRSFAGTYVDTVGKLKTRIQIKGSQAQLKTSGTPEQIRAILLSGIHAARLWHQMGGRRWHLIFLRRKIAKELQQIIGGTLNNAS